MTGENPGPPDETEKETAAKGPKYRPALSVGWAACRMDALAKGPARQAGGS